MNVDHASAHVILAKADGWTDIDWYEDSAGPAILTGKAPRDYPLCLGRPATLVPLYNHDLEEVRRLELKLVSDDAYDDYMRVLKSVCAKPACVGLAAPVARVSRHECASAGQRCEALVLFLELIGKRKEQK